MKIFYDTEFIEDGIGITLVSIGMVAENGDEYYAVSQEFDQRRIWNSPWLLEHVWPSLPQTPQGLLDILDPQVKPRAVIADEVCEFIRAHGPAPQLWADYGAFDHVVLSWLWGAMDHHPEGVPMFTCDLQQEAARLGLDDEDLPKQASGLHNALADARYNVQIAKFLDEVARKRGVAT